MSKCTKTARSRTFKLYGSDDGKNWRYLANFRRWMKHFDPRREALVQGFADATVKICEARVPGCDSQTGGADEAL